MDGGESTKGQQSSLRLVIMPWTNFQTQGDILNYDHLSLSPPPPIGMNDGIEKHLSSTTNKI
jgi:hypothetical protein